MRSVLKGALVLLALTPTAWSFCGFYVSQEPGSLFNKSSKVVLVRHGDHTVLTMANDYHGDPDSFGVVVPVPQEISPDMVKIADLALIDRLDQYSVPRLAQYFDEDPCPEPMRATLDLAPKAMSAREDMAGMAPPPMMEAAPDYGVRVEQSYSLDEYDITVIKAKNGEGLEAWLTKEGYKLPNGASPVLSSYIAQNMHFFLAKIDVGAQREMGLTWPRPLRVEYDSPKFMLPIRLGTLNADGAQDLLVFALTEHGRVETVNYRTAKLPTDVDVPEYIADGGNFTPFYTALFDRRVQRDGMSNVYLEYAWPMSTEYPCDPCTADMPTPNEFAPLGADWGKVTQDYHGGTVSSSYYLTRLHVRYNALNFPEDLVFQETRDNSTWQARYVVHRRFNGDTSCAEGRRYEADLLERQSVEVANLARLTGWDPREIREFVPPVPGKY
jgi:hypothetical protein